MYSRVEHARGYGGKLVLLFARAVLIEIALAKATTQVNKVPPAVKWDQNEDRNLHEYLCDFTVVVWLSLPKRYEDIFRDSFVHRGKQ